MSSFLVNIGVGREAPMFILALGFTLGHLFGPMKESTPKMKCAKCGSEELEEVKL